MTTPSFRKTAKLLYAAALTGTMMLAANSPFAGALAAEPALTPASITGTPSAFEREQAMSPRQLIERWAPFIKEASNRFGISEEWILAVIRMESGGRTLSDDNRPILSSAGAMGIMQIMPGTYDEMRQQHGLGPDPHDPHDNVMAGTAYLRWLRERYGYPKMFAAYNAGPGRLEARLADLRQLPGETRAYVRGISRILGTGVQPEAAAKVVAASERVQGPAVLTRPDGSSIAIESGLVGSIRASLPDEFVPGVRTVLTMGERRQGVTEDPATVASLLRTHGWQGSITKPVAV